VISIRRKAGIQRLTIDWTVRQPTLGYLPDHYKLSVPSVNATSKDMFVSIHSPDNQSWSMTAAIATLSSEQLAERISNTFPTLSGSQTSAAANDSDDAQETVVLFRNDNKATVERSGNIFEVPETTTADIQWRQNFPWPHWIPMLVLSAACIVVTGRRIVQQRPQRSFTSSKHDSSDHASTLVIEHTDSTPSSPGQDSQTDSSPS